MAECERPFLGSVGTKTSCPVPNKVRAFPARSRGPGPRGSSLQALSCAAGEGSRWSHLHPADPPVIPPVLCMQSTRALEGHVPIIPTRMKIVSKVMGDRGYK